MSTDPGFLELTAKLQAQGALATDHATMRLQAAASLPIFVGPAGVSEVRRVDEIRIEGPTSQMPLRVYWPIGQPRGTLHYIHGGGFSIGDLDIVDPAARRLCAELSMVIVTSTYRLAPEHPFPAAVDDSLAAARWVLANAAQLGGTTGPVCIAGDSAGGNLAAVMCIALREANEEKCFDAQLLLYPVADMRPSAEQNASRLRDADPAFRTAAMAPIIENYCPESDPADWRISPLAAADLSHLPPALIVVITVDPLHDEAFAYAERMREAGVRVELVSFDHLVHGFVHCAGAVPAAAEATSEVLARFANMVFGRP